MKVVFLAAALVLCGSSAMAESGTSVESAFRLCALFDSTGLASAPCEVTGWGSTVDVKIDMSAAEARKLCVQIADLARSEGWTFDPGWTLQIFSPYSGENTIAYCSL